MPSPFPTREVMMVERLARSIINVSGFREGDGTRSNAMGIN
jgi:hypothetical protein